jgi:CRISPR/Cas system CSM-associated protein Csm3 (group 7 of RAMP superfamily)
MTSCLKRESLMTNNPVNTMNPLVIDVTLIFETPPSVAAAGATGSIADRFAERNARGQFIIPGSQLKGKLRHACEQFLRSVYQQICESPRAETMCPNASGIDPQCLVCDLFGNPAFPSPLRFHDLVADISRLEGNDETTPSLRAMVSLNRRRATAAEGKLFLVETASYLPELQFSNSRAITGALRSEAQVKLLLAGLKLIRAWGGMKSRGAGWTIRAEVSAAFNGKTVGSGNWQEIKQLWRD